MTAPSHSQGGSLTCAECDARVPLPDDLEALSARCPYCGNANLLPRHVVESRRILVTRRRREVEDAAAAARSAAQSRSARRRSRRSALVLVLLGLVLAAGAGLGVYLLQDRRSRDPALTGMAQVQGLLPLYRASGCQHVVINPTVSDRRSQWALKMRRGGQCVNLIAATAAAEGRLALELITPHGPVTPVPAPGKLVHLVHCPRVDGQHQAVVKPSTKDFYTFVALDCPRPLNDPRPADSRSTGQAAVAARMKALYAGGCRHIVHPAERLDAAIKWTPRFPKSRQSNCLHILVMTGASDNVLTVTMKTPFGEDVAVPPPGQVVDFRFCASSGGPHPIIIKPSNDTFYTFAAVDCPRRVRRRGR